MLLVQTGTSAECVDTTDLFLPCVELVVFDLLMPIVVW